MKPKTKSKKLTKEEKLQRKRVIERRWQENNRQKKRELVKRDFLKFRDKRLAYKKAKYRKDKYKQQIYNRLSYLKRKGQIVLGECERCGSKNNLCMHHEDYSKPFQINILCKSCHNRHHNLKDSCQQFKEGKKEDGTLSYPSSGVTKQAGKRLQLERSASAKSGVGTSVADTHPPADKMPEKKIIHKSNSLRGSRNTPTGYWESEEEYYQNVNTTKKNGYEEGFIKGARNQFLADKAERDKEMKECQEKWSKDSTSAYKAGQEREKQLLAKVEKIIDKEAQKLSDEQKRILDPETTIIIKRIKSRIREEIGR